MKCPVTRPSRSSTQILLLDRDRLYHIMKSAEMREMEWMADQLRDSSGVEFDPELGRLIVRCENDPFLYEYRPAGWYWKRVAAVVTTVAVIVLRRRHR